MLAILCVGPREKEDSDQHRPPAALLFTSHTYGVKLAVGVAIMGKKKGERGCK